MKAAQVFIAIIALLVVAYWVSALLFPPSAFIPMVVADRGWRSPCDRWPIESYIRHEECAKKSNSPITTENANTPIASKSGACPLQVAAMYKNMDAFGELLNKGAGPKRCRGYPDDFFDLPMGLGADQTKRIFEVYKGAGIQHSNPNALLILQSKKRSLAGIEFALSMGATVNAEDLSGRTALHYSTSDLRDEAISATRLLVKNGANPEQMSVIGETPFMQAYRLLHTSPRWAQMEDALRDRQGRDQSISLPKVSN